jgi:hypothetical protein
MAQLCSFNSFAWTAENTVHSHMLTISTGMRLHHPAMHCITPFIKNLLP